MNPTLEIFDRWCAWRRRKFDVVNVIHITGFAIDAGVEEDDKFLVAFADLAAEVHFNTKFSMYAGYAHTWQEK